MDGAREVKQMEITPRRGLLSILALALLALALLAVFAASAQAVPPLVQHQSNGDRTAIVKTTGPDVGPMGDRRVGVAGRSVIPAGVTATTQPLGSTSTTWVVFGILAALVIAFEVATVFPDRRLAKMSRAAAGPGPTPLPVRQTEDESRRKAA
jgi:hypothetical protein